MGVAGEAFAGFRGLHAVFGLNPAVIHLAAWLCSRVKVISRLNGDVALLKPGFQASGAVCAVSADPVVRATDVMVNQVNGRYKKSPRGLLV